MGNAWTMQGRKPIMARRGAVPIVPQGTNCVHCHRKMNTFAGGSAKMPGIGPLCHPNVSGRPDCYHLVSLYGHQAPCEYSVCYEDHEDQSIYQKAKNATVIGKR